MNLFSLCSSFLFMKTEKAFHAPDHGTEGSSLRVNKRRVLHTTQGTFFLYWSQREMTKCTFLPLQVLEKHPQRASHCCPNCLFNCANKWNCFLVVFVSFFCCFSLFSMILLCHCEVVSRGREKVDAMWCNSPGAWASINHHWCWHYGMNYAICAD